VVHPECTVVETITELASKKTILFGPDGMLGYSLRMIFPEARPISHLDVDITDEDAVMKIVRQERPSLIINAAAYTDVDGCEDKRELAFAVNGHGPGHIAAACAEVGATLVHVSTDYVFDGLKKEYREDEIPRPVNTYGKSKLLGEDSVKKNMDDYRIIRTSWLYGSHGRNFVDTIIALSEKMTEVSVVNDQIGKPTYTLDLSRAVPEIISREPGIYHITNEGVCSWYEFACEIIPNAVPCSTAEFPRKAKRPAYSVLVNTKTAPLRHWKEAVGDYIRTKGGSS
jgi:dTDP-4-dehydrorhamnose reductase